MATEIDPAERELIFKEGYDLGVSDTKTVAYGEGYTAGLEHLQPDVDRLSARVEELERMAHPCCEQIDHQNQAES